MDKEMKKVVIFGAGKFGRMALETYKDRVVYFIDNNPEKQGKYISGIPVKSFHTFKEDKDRNLYDVIIAVKSSYDIVEQLKLAGNDNIRLYLQDDPRAYYRTKEVIYDSYLYQEKSSSEEEWNQQLISNQIINRVDRAVEEIYGQNILFDHIEVETVNRCNGNCDFCPVGRKRDVRKYKYMSDDLFQKIIDELGRINYDGKLALFSNNEPFLDEKIIERHAYARKTVPKARMHLFTNGTLLTIEKFVLIIQYLDELVIDNYHIEGKLLKPCREIFSYCEKHPELKNKTTIVVRDPKEILTSRGGDAPNRKNIVSYESHSCILPFKQMIIRPDGKVSLCCNDPLGKDTLGDVKEQSLISIWNGEKFQTVRDCLYRGRKYWEHCRNCDNFNLG